MKFKADRATLLKALGHIQSVAEKRNTIPILANTLIRVDGGELGFTSLERIWMRPTCEVNGLLSGYTGEGAKTVLPSFVAVCSRYPACRR